MKFTHRALFGGKGSVVVTPLGEALPAPFDAVLHCELKPGSSVGPHAQEHCGEVVIVTEGVGQARVDGVAQRLEAGAVVSLPLGATLELSNRSKTKPLRYLIVKAFSAGR